MYPGYLIYKTFIAMKKYLLLFIKHLLLWYLTVRQDLKYYKSYTTVVKGFVNRSVIAK